MTGRMNFKFWLVMSILLSGMAGMADAMERHVPSQYPNIQAAIDASVNGDTVIVSPGTYTGDGNRDIDFLGKAITVRSIDPNDPNIVAATIIDCQGTKANPHRGFYFHNGEGPNSVLSGITITNGWADYGAGIYCNTSSPTVTNCTFSGNSANYSGGGIDNNWFSNPKVKDCTFSGNSADDVGGGMYNRDSSSPTIESCTFTANSAGDGGGMCNYNSNPTVKLCIFSNNSAEWGGGMDNSYYSRPMVTNCTFSGNSAEYGGGMFNDYSSSPTVTNCTFSGNSADYAGGMLNAYYSRPIVKDCTFTDNLATYWAGGMYNSESSPTVTNCTFTGNSAEYGGGMYNSSGSPTVKNCTFSNNSAQYHGGGMYTYKSNPTVTNCILWADVPSEIYGGAPTVTYSDIQGGYSGTGNINADPCFVNPDSNNFHLLPSSPCINAGDPNYVAGPNETDFDGELRVMLGRIDMGADEFNPFEIEFIVVNKRRIGRTLFEYDCNTYLHNISLLDVENIQLEIVKTPENMKIIDPNVTFGDVVVMAGQSATSIDSCTFEIDRAKAIEPAEIIWWSSCELVADGQQMQHSGLSIVFLEDNISGDLTGEGKVDFADLAKLAEQWLGPPENPSADIAPQPDGDNIVNFLDFAELAENWGP